MTEFRNDKPIEFSLDISVLADGEPVGFAVVPDTIEYALADDTLGSLSLADGKMSGAFTAATDALGPQEIHVSLKVMVGSAELSLSGVAEFTLVAAPEPVLSGQITFVFAAAPAPAPAPEANPT